MNDDSPTYYLQTSDGAQGPVHLDTLRHRAALGEVTGASRIASSPEGPWIPATKLAELELDWRIQDENGQDRPLCHILALRSLVESEEVQPFWEIIHEPSGEDYQVVDALCSALLAQNRVLENKLARSLHPGSGERPDPEASDGNEDPQQLRLARDEAVHERAKWKRLYEDEVGRNREREQDLLSEIEELRASQRKGSDKIRALERRNQQVEELLLAPGGEQSGSGGDRDLTTAYHELHLQLEHLMDSIHLRAGHLEDERERNRELSLELTRERAAYAEAIGEKEELNAETLDQLSKLEQGHTDLIRAYRELHDRFIRMRNQIPDAPSDSTARAAGKKANDPQSVPNKLDMM